MPCFRLAVMVVVLAVGCTETMEQRKAAFEEQMQPEVGVKPKDYYLDAWDLPANRETLKDGGEAVTWEWRSADGRMGWQKTLVFSPDGMLREYRWTHWPRK